MHPWRSEDVPTLSWDHFSSRGLVLPEALSSTFPFAPIPGAGKSLGLPAQRHPHAQGPAEAQGTRSHDLQLGVSVSCPTPGSLQKPSGWTHGQSLGDSQKEQSRNGPRAQTRHFLICDKNNSLWGRNPHANRPCTEESVQVMLQEAGQSRCQRKPVLGNSWGQEGCMTGGPPRVDSGCG